MTSTRKGILAIGLVALGAHDALALAGFSEPMGFGDGVLLSVAMSWFVALPVTALLATLITYVCTKQRSRRGQEPKRGITFGLSLLACLGLYGFAIVAFVSIGVLVFGA